MCRKRKDFLLNKSPKDRPRVARVNVNRYRGRGLLLLDRGAVGVLGRGWGRKAIDRGAVIARGGGVGGLGRAVGWGWS